LGDLRGWLDDFLEDQLELSDESKAKIAQARQEISDGQYRLRETPVNVQGAPGFGLTFSFAPSALCALR